MVKMTALKKRKTLKFLSDRIYIDKNSCWNFTGPLDSVGYGQIASPKIRDLFKEWKVHRLSYKIFNGEIGNKLVLHTCDNRKCFNPDHLFLGTQMDNMKDRMNKGRYRSISGENNKFSKLTKDNVKQIRKLKGQKSIRALAKQFNVGKTTIEKVLNNTTWRHI